MRKIINSTYITLDGVQDRMEEWHFGYFGEEAATYAQELLFNADALLNGRETYVAFAESWPSMAEQAGEFGARMNSLPHYVASTTLKDEDATWGDSTVIRENVPEAIAALKKEDGKDILQYGFGQLTHTLVEHGLLDELHLWIHPVFAGSDKSAELVSTPGFFAKWELIGTTTFTTGVIVARYRPAAD